MKKMKLTKFEPFKKVLNLFVILYMLGQYVCIRFFLVYKLFTRFFPQINKQI